MSGFDASLENKRLSISFASRQQSTLLPSNSNSKPVSQLPVNSKGIATPKLPEAQSKFPHLSFHHYRTLISILNFEVARLAASYILLIYITVDLLRFNEINYGEDQRAVWMLVFLFQVILIALANLHLSLLLILALNYLFRMPTPDTIIMYGTLSLVLVDVFFNLKTPTFAQTCAFVSSVLATGIHIALNQTNIPFSGFYTSYVLVMLAAYYIMREDKSWWRNITIDPRNR